MLPPEQLLNNKDLDRRIREADAEYEEYIRYFEEKRKQLYIKNKNTILGNHTPCTSALRLANRHSNSDFLSP